MQKKSAFYYFYLGFVILFFIAIIIGLFVLHSFLKTYESAQPKSIAQSICNEYIKKGKITELREKYGLRLSEYETDENFKNTFGKLLNDKDYQLNYSSKVPEGSDICFIVKQNKNSVLSISLSQNSKKGRFGIKGYKVDAVSLIGDFYKSVKITFPSNAEITVNGQPLSEKYINRLPLPEIKDVDFGKNAVHICTCELNDLLNSDVKIATANGKGFVVTKNDNDYTVSERFSETFAKEIEEFAIAGSKVYAAHMQDDKPLSELSKYVDASSDFYKNVKNTIVSFAWDHEGYDFENVECQGIQKHSDSIYSCRVSFIHVLKLGSKRYRDNFDKRIYIRIDEKGKKIIDMQSVG